MNLNIPEDDDAHMIFLPLPYEGSPDPEWTKKYEDLEQYFLNQVIGLTNSRIHTRLPGKFAEDPPARIESVMDELISEWYQGDDNTHVHIKITNPQTQSSTHLESRWFKPVVVNHLRRALRNDHRGEVPPLEGYQICFMSKNTEVPLLMVVEHVLASEDADEEENSPVFKSEHLTPLQEQLDESIRAAGSVIREMNLMERREQRMRRTADNINWRVRNFSYFSVFVLILVTFFQVTYLKRYFHKKKLL